MSAPASNTPSASATVVPRDSLVRAAPLALEALSTTGLVLDREWLRAGDVAPFAAELWRDGCLRRGLVVPLEALEFRVTSDPATEPGAMTLRWSVDGASGHAALDRVGALDVLAQRLERRCVAAGLLHTGGTCERRWTTITPTDGDTTPSGLVRLEVPFRVAGRAPEMVPVPMADLRRWSETRGNVGTNPFPVFYPASLAQQVDRLARRGEADGIETGAALLGVLVRATDEPECGLLLTGALPLEHADASATHLELRGATWSGIHAALRTRRLVNPAVPEILVGQAHAHPFLPGRCSECSRQADCDLSTAWASTEDDLWMRSVFATQPWALCQVKGYTPRGEPVDRLYTRHRASLQPRGYHLLPDSVVPVVLPGVAG